MHRWVGFEPIHFEAQADRIRVQTRSSTSRGRTSREYAIVFEHPHNGTVSVSGWVMNSPDEVVRALDTARRQNVTVTTSLGSGFYTFMVGLTALFFACGAAIPLGTELRRRHTR